MVRHSPHLPNITNPSSHAPALEIHSAKVVAKLFINFPLVNSFSSESQGKSTNPAISSNNTRGPLPPCFHHLHQHTHSHKTPSPASPSDDLFIHMASFHSALRVGLSCGYTVSGLWLPLWPPSKC